MDICIFCEAAEAQPGSEFCSDHCKEQAEVLVAEMINGLPLSEIMSVLGPISDDPEWQKLVKDLEYVVLREN